MLTKNTHNCSTSLGKYFYRHLNLIKIKVHLLIKQSVIKFKGILCLLQL